jgi:hypothetical protein
MTPPTPTSRNKNRKPGLTAKGDQRQYVRHSYNDRSNEVIDNLTTSDENTLRLYQEDSVGGPFPLKLQIVLKVTEKLGQQHIISWLPHGRSFMIHKPREFEEEVMGKFFKQTKLTSFRRQLNLYDFQRITHGRDAGSYYHELFLRGRPLLAKRMVRRKVKGTKIRASSSPDEEPNFYSMTSMGGLGQNGLGQSSLGQSSLGQSSLGQSSLGQSSLGQAPNTIVPRPGTAGMMMDSDPTISSARINSSSLSRLQGETSGTLLQGETSGTLLQSQNSRAPMPSDSNNRASANQSTLQHQSALNSLQGSSLPQGSLPQGSLPQRSMQTPNLQSSLQQGSLQSSLQQSSIYSDLMNSSAAINQMNHLPQSYGGAMNNMSNLDYLALTSALQRNSLASSLTMSNNYPSYLNHDVALLDSMSRLQAAGVDPRMSQQYNEPSLFGGPQYGGMSSNYPTVQGSLSSMLLNQQPFGGGQSQSMATRILLEQMNNPVSMNRQSTMLSNDEKQNNAIEQLLLLQKDQSGASLGVKKTGDSPQGSKGNAPTKEEEQSAVLAL